MRVHEEIGLLVRRLKCSQNNSVDLLFGAPAPGCAEIEAFSFLRRHSAPFDCQIGFFFTAPKFAATANQQKFLADFCSKSSISQIFHDGALVGDSYIKLANALLSVRNYYYQIVRADNHNFLRFSDLQALYQHQVLDGLKNKTIIPAAPKVAKTDALQLSVPDIVSQFINKGLPSLESKHVTSVQIVFDDLNERNRLKTRQCRTNYYHSYRRQSVLKLIFREINDFLQPHKIYQPEDFSILVDQQEQQLLNRIYYLVVGKVNLPKMTDYIELIVVLFAFRSLLQKDIDCQIPIDLVYQESQVIADQQEELLQNLKFQ